jgi:AraC-like DNA-binding protein
MLTIFYLPSMKEFFYTLILLGSIQGVIVCCLLLFSKRQTLSTRLLAAIIGLITLPGFHLYFHFNGWFERNAVTLFIHDMLPMIVTMPLGPLIWFYVRSLTDRDFKFGRKEIRHFFPAILDLLPKIVAWCFYISQLTGDPFTSREELVKIDAVYNQYVDIPRWLSLTIYLVITARYLRGVTPNTAPAHQKLMRWLRLFTNLFTAFQFIWLLFLIPYILPASSATMLQLVDWFPIYIPMAVLVYWLGIQGYLTSITTHTKKLNEQADWIEPVWQKLKDSMEQQRLYLDPALTVAKLAEHTGVQTRQISEILNQHRFTNFNAFINHYRVEEFRKRSMEPEAGQFTIAGLALKCGFNSAASFQRIFKQVSGVSPSVFLKNNRKKEGIASGQSLLAEDE